LLGVTIFITCFFLFVIGIKSKSFNNKIIIFISHDKDLLDKNYKKFKIENESLVAI